MDRFVYYKIELITQIKTCTVASEGNDVYGGEGVECQNKRKGRLKLLPAAY